VVEPNKEHRRGQLAKVAKANQQIYNMSLFCGGGGGALKELDLYFESKIK
jgi:hypothetical protein